MSMQQYGVHAAKEQYSKSLQVYYCGYEKCVSGHYFGPAVRSQFLLHFVLSGKGEYRVGGQAHCVSAGELFLIRPGESTYYAADNDDPWEYMWVAFDGFEANELIKRIGLGEKYTITVPSTEEFRRNMQGIIDEGRSGNPGEYRTLGYFYSAMSLLEQKTKTSTFEEEYLSKAIQYIHHNFGYSIKISDISRFIGIDRTYLYKLFIAAKNTSPKQYLLNVRINAAKNMLMTKRHSVAEVALSCGFSDSASFCNQFKRITGKTPIQCIREAEGKIYTDHP